MSIHIFAILARDVISNFGKLFWISISRKIFYLLTSLARRRPPFFSTIIRPSVTKFLPISSLFEASETVTNSRVPILYSVLILTCRSRTSSLRALSPEAAYSSCFYKKKKKWKKCLFCMYVFIFSWKLFIYYRYKKILFPLKLICTILTSGGNAKKANPYSLAKPGRPVNDDGRAAHFALGMVSEK